MPAQLLIQITHHTARFHGHHPSDRINRTDLPQGRGEHHHAALQRHALAVVPRPGTAKGQGDLVLSAGRSQSFDGVHRAGTDHQLSTAGLQPRRQDRGVLKGIPGMALKLPRFLQQLQIRNSAEGLPEGD